MKRIVAIMADLAGAVLLAAGIMMKVKSQREVSVIGETMVIGGLNFPKPHFDLEFSVILPFLEVTV